MTVSRLTPRRVVVTGVGIISPIGNTVPEFWANLLAGNSGIKSIESWDTTDFPAHVAGIVTDFEPTNFMDRQLARRTDRFTHLAVAATAEAMDSSAIDMDDEDRERFGIVMGTAIAGISVVERESLILESSGPRRVSPVMIPAVIGNMAACVIAIEYGILGPALCPVGACATGCMAVGDAFERIAAGDIDIALAGGTESVTTPLAVATFGRLGALSRSEDPMLACHPFDVDRDGTVLAEGAATLVLESEEHARERGARILAEIVGYGVTCDAYHMAAPDPNGSGAARAMSVALKRARMSPSEVTWVCAHGTATPLNDISESRAVKQVFGADHPGVPVSSSKFAIGHTLGAAGAVSSIAAVRSIVEGVIPGTLNLQQKDPECDINVIAENVNTEVEAVVVNAFGFGGQNASAVFRRYRN